MDGVVLLRALVVVDRVMGDVDSVEVLEDDDEPC